MSAPRSVVVLASGNLAWAKANHDFSPDDVEKMAEKITREVLEK